MIKQTLKSLCFAILMLSYSISMAQMTEAEFGDYVHGFLQKKYSQKTFVRTKENLVIESGEMQLGLQNLYALYKLENVTDNKAFDSVLEEHFNRMFARVDQLNKLDNISWSEVKTHLFLQIAPIEYSKEASLVSGVIDQKAIKAVVVDRENSYRYVTQKDLVKWKVTASEIFIKATENSSRISEASSLYAGLDGDKLIISQIGDGYDAARILVPDFRKYVVSQLGSPFYAAIPNRDFLIMWAVDNSEEFKQKAINNVKEDFRTQPYPLTDSIFEVSEDAIQLSK